MVKELSTYFMRSDDRYSACRWCRRGSGRACSAQRRRGVWSPVPVGGRGCRGREVHHEGSVVGNVGGRRLAHGENLERSNPVEENLVLSTVVSVSFLAPRRIVAAEL